LWNKETLKSLVLPGGLLLLAVMVLQHGGLLTISVPAINYYYYAVFGAGVVLAWRFQSSQILFALITLWLAHRAIEFFSGGRVVSSGPGHIAFAAVALLLPLNFIVLSLIRERGLSISATASRMALLFFEAVFVAVICRPGETSSPAFVHSSLFGAQLSHSAKIPYFALFVFIAALAVLLTRFLLYRKPVESGLLWSLSATFLALQAGGAGRIASAYVATAGLILVSSIIENSYFLAYHDELTGLPARRAFNDALLRLEEPYAIAVVDIDHFKTFNDTYGHETGDQVLRMVAARLARVTGGGRAFRVGGEEFSILFPRKSMKEVLAHLELLRDLIAGSAFRVRGGQERRRASRSPDRRHGSRRKLPRPRRASVQSSMRELSVTVSIGVAEPNTSRREVEQVIQAADHALYQAKQAGRNRVETAIAVRASRLKRSIA
jgi:diguanylate cyclase (GGDEF)-like protein